MPRFSVEINDSAQSSLAIYKWRVFDSGNQRVTAYTVRRESAEDYAKQMNEKGYIEVGE